MILANVRASLSRNDAQLVLQLVGRRSRTDLEAAEACLRDEGIDSLLDDPRLLAALMEAPLGARASLPLFCYVVVRNALKKVGEHDRVLADYTSAILLHFGLRDRATRIGTADDEQYDTLAAILDSLDGPNAQHNFLVRAHLGNYALWISGIFPDLIEHRRWRRGGPDLDYYEELGRLGFQLAADHRLAHEHGLAPLYHEAAQRFATMRMALNAVSDSLFFPNNHSPDRLMRQVRDEGRWRVS
ncbi:MAG: hypothetical protein ACR2G6_02470 [Gemmatimonadaceae bacterium]